MRIGQYTNGDGPGAPWTGVRLDDQVVDLPEAGVQAGVGIPNTTTELLASWEWREKADLAVEYARETGVGLHDAEDLQRHAPVTDPQKVVCVGLNYVDHAEEGGNPIPETPVLFSKFPTSITGPDRTVS